jgi:DNA (cytosine-5)-methyltransferase 1
MQNGHRKDRPNGGLYVNETEHAKTLTAAGDASTYIAFTPNDSGADAGDICPTLRAGGHDKSHANGGIAPAIAFKPGQSASARTIGAQEDVACTLEAAGGGNNQQAIAYTIHGSDRTVSTATETEVAGSIRTKPPGSIENSSTTVALQPIAWNEELNASEDLAGTIQRGGQGGRHDGVMTTSMAVRRLTPIECERLQGFADNYTAIPGAADGPRYKAIGNSMAVPVMRWLGERIQMVENLINEGKM